MTNIPYIKNPQLDGETFLLEGNNTGVLLFHGFTATTTEVRLIGECLNKAGFTVSAPLLPGHGTHPQDLNRVSWRDWIACGEKYLFELKKHCKKIIIGGGVMNQKQVFPYIYKYLQEFVNNYVVLPGLSDYIVSPGLGDHAGITGALILVHQALQEKNES